ncbi:helicase HerA-like domain-containing protein [Methanocaldococcus sp.]
MKVEEKNIGLVKGESSIDYFEFSINPKENIKFGEFVVTKNREGEYIIGTVRKIINRNWLLLGGKDTYQSLEIDVSQYGDSLKDNEEIVGIVKILGKLDIKNGVAIKPNRVPIPSGERVYLLNSEVLREIYGNDGVEIGTLLLREDVPVNLKINDLISRHFSILAVTGAGKSNAVAVLVSNIVEKFRGTVIILDPHGDYIKLKMPKTGDEYINIIEAKINPTKLHGEELADLIGIKRDSHIQRSFLVRAWDTVLHENKDIEGRELIKKLIEKLNNWVDGEEGKYWDPIAEKWRNLEKIDANKKNSLVGITMRLSRFLRNYHNLITGEDLISSIEEGKANIIDLGALTEEQMRLIVGKFLKEIFDERVSYEKAKKNIERYKNIRRYKEIENFEEEIRKIENRSKALAEPILIIVEEAHIFAPKNEKNEASIILSKIAREGRKFGVGLGIVSQRPSKLDEDVLSQTNTKIILRIVNPRDQKYVLEASEQLSSDLLEDIPSLGKGEAVIVGQAIELPALVKIYNFKELGGEYGGEDIDIVSVWRKREEEKFEDDIDV